MNKNGKKSYLVLYGILPLSFCIAVFLLLEFMLAPIIQPLIQCQERRSNPWELNDNSTAPNRLKELLRENEKVEEIEGAVKLPANEYPAYGEEIGILTVDGTAVDARLFYGDGTKELNYGAGIYVDAHIPGEGGTILVAGHTATFFRDFESAQIGAVVTIETFYGEYCYEIVEMKVAEATDTTAYDLEKEKENLIMYTCYPFNTLGYTKDRYFIYGKLISGPTLEITANEQPVGGLAK